MTFDDRWEKIWIASGLPDMARKQVPQCLSPQIKQVIAQSNQSDEAIGALFKVAVDKINQGSVSSIEELIKTELQ